MECLRMIISLVIFLICFAPRQSNGSLLQILRKIARGDDRHSSMAAHQMSPSPSPGPAINLDSWISPSPTNEGTCDKVFNRCDIKDYSMTACVPFIGNGSQASYLLLLNNGDNSMKLNIVVRPTNIVVNDLEISGRHIKKVNLPPYTVGDSSIMLNVGNENCIIQMGASIPEGFYTNYVTPINGMYLFFATAILIGGAWACCQLVKRRRRHLDGVPYRELEMGAHQESTPQFVIESPNGWDDNWNDDWDEEKAVRSSLGIREVLGNGGGSLKYVDTNQWRNDWDDS